MRLATPHDAAAITTITRAHPGTGALLEADWLLKTANPSVPWSIYLVDETAALRVSQDGGRALLCGHPPNTDEITAFFQFAAIQHLTASFTPHGWQTHSSYHLLARPPSSTLPPPPAPPKGMPSTHTALSSTTPHLTKQPPLSQVLAVLESASGPLSPPAARDGFLANNAARRNHGLACFYGVCHGTQLLSTAAICALTPAEGYIACVETRPAYQAHGYASYLLRQICADYATHLLTLSCPNALIGFYSPHGFAPQPTQIHISTPTLNKANLNPR